MKTLTRATQRQITRVGQDAVRKAVEEFYLNLDKEGAQRVHTRGNEFVAAIDAAVIDALQNLSVSN